MTDTLSKTRRSWNMSRIKGSDTKPELIVRSALYKKGFRFSLHNANLPGKPDIVLPKYKTVIFVHGCFWHRHKGCRFAYTPKTRTAFWNKKFNENVTRDKKKKSELRKADWKIYTIWECETEKSGKFERKINTIISALLLQCP